jgi:tetratricopeptide (TPR) repeat protein/CHAT domain-containing protein
LNHPSYSCSTTLILILTVLVMAGCGKEVSREQRQADSTFVAAGEEIRKGEYHSAQELIQKAYAIDAQLGRSARQAEEQQLMGTALRALAEFDSAITAYARAGELYKSVADRSAARSMTLEIAGIHQFIGEEHKAFDQYSEALRLARVFSDERGVLDIQWAMLPAARSTGNIEDESKNLDQLLDSYMSSGNVDMQGKVYYEKGISGLYRNDNNAALEQFLRTLTFSEQTRDSLQAIRSLLKLAVTYENMGQTFEAFQSFSDGLRRSDVTRGAEGLREEMLMRIGNIYLGNAQESEAGRFYRAALNSAMRRNNKIAEGYLFAQLGHCLLDRPDQWEEADRNFQSALSLFQGISFGKGIAYAQFSLGVAAEKKRAFTDAVQLYSASVREFEQLQWKPDRDDLTRDCEEALGRRLKTTPYESLISLLLELGRYEEAFWYMERRVGNYLYTSLSEFDADPPNARLKAALTEFRHRKALLAGTEHLQAEAYAHFDRSSDQGPSITSLLSVRSRQLEDARDSVVDINPWFENVVRGKNIGLAEVQRLLPPGTTFVEYFAADRSLFMYVATANRAAVRVAAVDRPLLLSQVHEFEELLRTREQYVDSLEVMQRRIDGRIQELSSLLYSSFIRPIEGDIAGASRVEVVLQPEFTGFPVHALRRGAVKGNPYVAEQTLVSYIPSAFSLTVRPPPAPPRHSDQRNAEIPQKDIVAIGHQGTTDWDAEYELRDIRAFFKDARLYFGQEATIHSLRSESGDLLHIALEFRYDEQNPENSYVILSDGKAFNSTTIVRWGEFYSVPPFPTVVISDLANDRATARPFVESIFLANGSTTVISQMYVPTRKAKKYFGEVLYTTLLAGENSETAFRQMQLQMIVNPEYAPVYLWAPFALWGR